MKTEIAQLIDRLASKELTFGCLGIALKDAFDNEEDDIEKPSNRIHWQEDDDLICLGDEYDGAFKVLFCPRTKARIFIGAGGIAKWFKPLGHPILIGDVLEKLEEHFAWGYRETSKKALASTTKYEDKTVAKLWRLWKACGGADKSLQSIFEEAEWEGACPLHPSHIPSIKSNQAIPVGICTDCWNLSVSTNLIQIPKQKPIRELFEFLLSLNLTE